jgi:concanavalin A-like lectin/glucanase superfamily protein
MRKRLFSIILIFLALIVTTPLSYAEVSEQYSEDNTAKIDIWSDDSSQIVFKRNKPELVISENGSVTEIINPNMGEYAFGSVSPSSEVYFHDRPTEGQTVKIISNGTESTFQPHSLNFNNDLGQLEQISMPYSVPITVDGEEAYYNNAYGTGLHLKYKYSGEYLKEELIIDSKSMLPNPSQYVLDGGNPVIDLNFIYTSSAHKIVVDGAEWDRKNDMTGLNDIEIKDENDNLLYIFKKPSVLDSYGNHIDGIYKLKKSGNSLYITVRVPYSFFIDENTVYPVSIDPTTIFVNTVNATIGTTPEFSNCEYLHCEAEIVIQNNDDIPITMNYTELNLDVQIPYINNYWFEIEEEVDRNITIEECDITDKVKTNCQNVTSTIKEIIKVDLSQDYLFTIQPRGKQNIKLHAIADFEHAEFKYNVSFTYNGVDYLIDPYFYSGVSDFDDGTYINTSLNVSGFVQLNSTYSSGSYTSKVYDAFEKSDWLGFNWSGTEIEDLPDNTLIETSLHNPANMTGNVLLLHLDDGALATTFLDDSSLGNDGACTACPDSTSTSVWGTTFDFTSLNGDIISIPDSTSLDITAAITMEFWIQVDNAAAQPDIFTKGSFSESYSVWVDTGGEIEFLINGNALSGTVSVSDGNWHHVMCTYDGSNKYIYIDGQLDTTEAQTGAIATTTTPLTISTLAYDFDGRLDEVALYNRALDSTEALNHYLRSVNDFDISVRSCDDTICSGESWTQISDSKSNNLSLLSNRYFQYMYDFSTSEVSYSPKLYNVSIEYVDAGNPILNFTYPTPANGSNINTSNILIKLNLTEGNLFNLTFDWDNTSYHVYYDEILFQYSFNNISELTENSTQFKDVSLQDDLATCTGAECPTLIQGPAGHGTALDFDGADVIKGNTNLGLIEDYSTLEAWIRWDGGATHLSCIVGDSGIGDNFCFGAQDNHVRILGGGIANQDFANDSDVFDGSWHHIVLVNDPVNSKLYVDGEYRDIKPASFSPSASSEVWIGQQGGTSRYWDGGIDDVIFWNYNMTADEVAFRYQSYFYKNSANNWFLEVNRTDLVENENHTFEACATDIFLNSQCTGEWFFSYDQLICNPAFNTDWIISDNQTCDNVIRDIGTGQIQILNGGSLNLINNAKVKSFSYPSIERWRTTWHIKIQRGSEFRVIR